MSCTVDKTPFAKSPSHGRAKESGGAEVKPSLQKDAAALLGDGGRHVSRFGDGAVRFCAAGAGACGADGASGNVGNDDSREIVGGNLERLFIVIGGHRPSVARWDWAECVSKEKNPVPANLAEEDL